MRIIRGCPKKIHKHFSKNSIQFPMQSLIKIIRKILQGLVCSRNSFSTSLFFFSIFIILWVLLQNFLKEISEVLIYGFFHKSSKNLFETFPFLLKESFRDFCKKIFRFSLNLLKILLGISLKIPSGMLSFSVQFIFQINRQITSQVLDIEDFFFQKFYYQKTCRKSYMVCYGNFFLNFSKNSTWNFS